MDYASEWIPASDKRGDPVGRYGDDWGFFDESESTWYGGYKNEAEAREALDKYCMEFL